MPTVGSIDVAVRPPARSVVCRGLAVSANPVDVAVRRSATGGEIVFRGLAVATTAPVGPSARRAGVASGQFARSADARAPWCSVVFCRPAVPTADPVDLPVGPIAVQIRRVSSVPTTNPVGVPVCPPAARFGGQPGEAVRSHITSVRLSPPSPGLGIRPTAAWLGSASARFREPAHRLRKLRAGIVGEGGALPGVPRDHVGHADAAVSVHRTAASAARACRGVGMATGAGGVALVGHSVSSRTSGARLGRLTFEHPAASPGLPGLVVPGELFVIVRIPAVRDDTLPRISSPCVALRRTEADEQVKFGFGEWSNRRRVLLRVRNYLRGLAVMESDLVAAGALRGVKEIVGPVELARPGSGAVREADADRNPQARLQF